MLDASEAALRLMTKAPQMYTVGRALREQSPQLHASILTYKAYSLATKAILPGGGGGKEARKSRDGDEAAASREKEVGLGGQRPEGAFSRRQMAAAARQASMSPYGRKGKGRGWWDGGTGGWGGRGQGYNSGAGW